MNDTFRKLAHQVSLWAGTPVAFSLALLVILAWVISGPLFAFSDTWQLVINTGTTIVTFLMVFLIQNTQNRDSRALQLKIDELILYTEGADNELVELEDLSDEQMDRLERRYHRLARALGKSGGRKSAAYAEKGAATSRSNGRQRRRRTPSSGR